MKDFEQKPEEIVVENQVELNFDAPPAFDQPPLDIYMQDYIPDDVGNEQFFEPALDSNPSDKSDVEHNLIVPNENTIEPQVTVEPQVAVEQPVSPTTSNNSTLDTNVSNEQNSSEQPTLVGDPDAQVNLYLDVIEGMQYPKNNPKNDLQAALASKLNISPDDETRMKSEFDDMFSTVKKEVVNIVHFRKRGIDDGSNLSQNTRVRLEQDLKYHNVAKVATNELFDMYRKDFANNNLQKNEYGKEQTYYQAMGGSFSDLAPDFKGVAANMRSPFKSVVIQDLKDAQKTGNTSDIVISANYNQDYRNALNDVISSEHVLSNKNQFFGSMAEGLSKNEFLENAVKYLNDHNKSGSPNLKLQESTTSKGDIVKSVSPPDFKLLNKKGFEIVKEHIRDRILGKNKTEKPAEKLDEKESEEKKSHLDEKMNNEEEKKQDKKEEKKVSASANYEMNGLAKFVAFALDVPFKMLNAIGKGAGQFWANNNETIKEGVNKAGHAAGNKAIELKDKIKEMRMNSNLSNAQKAVDAQDRPVSSMVYPEKPLSIDLAKKYSDLSMNLFEVTNGNGSALQEKIDTFYLQQSLGQINKLDQMSLSDAKNVISGMKDYHAEVFDAKGQNNTTVPNAAILATRQQMDLMYDAMLNPLQKKVRELKEDGATGEYSSLVDEVNTLRNREYEHYLQRAKNTGNPVEVGLAQGALSSAILLNAANQYALYGDINTEHYKDTLVGALKSYHKYKSSNVSLGDTNITNREDLLSFGRNASQLMTFERDNIEQVLKRDEVVNLINNTPELKDLDTFNKEKRDQENKKMMEEIMDMIEKIFKNFGNVFKPMTMGVRP